MAVQQNKSTPSRHAALARCPWQAYLVRGANHWRNPSSPPHQRGWLLSRQESPAGRRVSHRNPAEAGRMTPGSPTRRACDRPCRASRDNPNQHRCHGGRSRTGRNGSGSRTSAHKPTGSRGRTLRRRDTSQTLARSTRTDRPSARALRAHRAGGRDARAAFRRAAQQAGILDATSHRRGQERRGDGVCERRQHGRVDGHRALRPEDAAWHRSPRNLRHAARATRLICSTSVRTSIRLPRSCSASR